MYKITCENIKIMSKNHMIIDESGIKRKCKNK